MVIESDADSQRAHFLLIVIKNHELTVNSIILGDQVEKWDPNEAQCQVIFRWIAFSFVRLQIVTNFKYCPLRLQVVKNFGVHLNWQLVSLHEDRVQTIIQNSSLVRSRRKSFS